MDGDGSWGRSRESAPGKQSPETKVKIDKIRQSGQVFNGWAVQFLLRRNSAAEDVKAGHPFTIWAEVELKKI